MLTEIQIHHLAEKINEEVSLNLLGEKMEQPMFWFIVKTIDAKVQQVVPPQMYHVLFSVNQGINEEETENLMIRLKEYLKANLQLPFVSKDKEQQIIEIFTSLFVTALSKGNKFNYSWEELKQI
jgi:hypothetical protein